MKTPQEEIVDLVARDSNKGGLMPKLLEILKGVKLRYNPKGLTSPYFITPPVNSVGTITGVSYHNTKESIIEFGWVYVQVDFGTVQNTYRVPIDCPYEEACMEVLSPKNPGVKRLGSFRITLRNR